MNKLELIEILRNEKLKQKMQAMGFSEYLNFRIKSMEKNNERNFFEVVNFNVCNYCNVLFAGWNTHH